MHDGQKRTQCPESLLTSFDPYVWMATAGLDVFMTGVEPPSPPPPQLHPYPRCPVMRGWDKEGRVKSLPPCSSPWVCLQGMLGA